MTAHEYNPPSTTSYLRGPHERQSASAAYIIAFDWDLATAIEYITAPELSWQEQ